MVSPVSLPPQPAIERAHDAALVRFASFRSSRLELVHGVFSVIQSPSGTGAAAGESQDSSRAENAENSSLHTAAQTTKPVG